MYLLLLKAPPFGGKGCIVQVDESLFRGKRKSSKIQFKTGTFDQKRE